MRRVHDIALDRSLAFKMIRRRFSNDYRVVGRFIEEAQLTPRQRHPGIGPADELGRLGDARPYFTIEAFRGHTLDEVLAS